MFTAFESIRTKLLVVFLLAVPAWAQFEVNPDHFDDKNSKSVAASTAELQSRIEEAHACLLGYEAQLKARSQSVEETRHEASSAGIQGDGAGSYLAVYEQQRKELEVLQQSLGARIEDAQNTINALEAQLTLAATRADSPQPLRRRGQGAKARIVAQRTMR